MTAHTDRHPQFWLWIILALGFVLRFAASDFGLPHLYHADEPIVVNHALAYGTGDLNPHFFKIPPLTSYLLFFVYGIYFLAGLIGGKFSGVQDFEILFYSDPSSFYWIARLVFGVMLGTLTIFILYLLVRRYFNEKSALISALLLAVCFLHVRESHYVYADIPLVLVLVCSFAWLFRLDAEGASVKAHCIAGALIGLATAVKYNGGALIIPYVYLSLFSRNGKRHVLLLWAAAALSGLAVFTLLNPYWLMDFNFFWSEIRAESRAHEGGADWLRPLTYSLPGGLGWPLWLAAIAGLADSLRRWDKRRGALWIFCVSYYAIISLWGQPYARYALPLMPFLIVIASDWIVRISVDRKLLLTGLVFVTALPTLAHAVLFDVVMSNQDSRTQAKEWIETHIPAGSRIALDLEFYMPRLEFSKKQLESKKSVAANDPHFSEKQMRRLDFMMERSEARPSYELYSLRDAKEKGEESFLFHKPGIPYDMGALRSGRIEYVVTVRLREKDARDEFYGQLEREGKLIAAFNPYRHARRLWPMTHPLTGGPFLFEDMLARERNGQPLRIFQIPQEDH